MRIHHLNCGTMCPFGGRLFDGRSPLLGTARIVCHCLLVEAEGALILVDTGFGTADVARPRQRLGLPFAALVRPRPDPAETAIAQVRALGHDPADVRHIVLTHLDLDHAGGLADFPAAEVHVFRPEHEAAMQPGLRERLRYRSAQWEHGPRWVLHEAEGDRWLGFECVRVLPGSGAEVALVPLAGHTRGHTGVAIRGESGWLLHCGDAYFHGGEIADPPSCPPGLRAFASATALDRGGYARNVERLRELARERAGEVTLFCSHDAAELERLAAGEGRA